MSVTTFRKASRAKKFLRILLEGPSGSGKTWSALLIAYGMIKMLGGKIFIIDTEKGSSNSYTHVIPDEFFVGTLDAPYHPARLQSMLQEAVDAGATLIIVDSITHFWEGSGGCLEINETLAKSKFRGNTYAAWSETKKIWRRAIEGINALPCHVILTGRSKTETTQVSENGRSTVKRLGMKLLAGDQIEYEMDLAFSIVHDQHLATCIKDRTALFVDKLPEAITTEFGERLVKWLQTADTPAAVPELAEKINIEPSLFEKVKQAIAENTNGTLSSFPDRIRQRHHEGLLSESECAELLKQVERKQQG